MLQAIQAAARIHRGIEIRGRQSQALRLARAVARRRSIQAEGIAGIGLLSRDHPAPEPLGRPVHSGEGHRADDPIPVYDRSPHLVVQAARFGCSRLIESGFERRVARQPFAARVFLSEGGSRQEHRSDHQRPPRNSRQPFLRFHRFPRSNPRGCARRTKRIGLARAPVANRSGRYLI